MLTLEVPPGALGQDTQIKVTTVSKDQLHEDLRELAGDGPAYRLEPDGLVFSQPVPISVRVPREALPADLAEGSIVEFTLITRSRDGLVEVLDDVELETQADGSIVARAKVSHFSDVAATSPAEVPLLGIHIDPIDFGDVLLGTEVIKQTAILINTGDEKTGFVPPNSLTYSAKGVPPDFLAFVVANPTFTEPLRTGFANPTGYTIAPIKFTPLRRGKHTGVLEAISGIPDPVADRLVGEGILPIGRRSLFSKSVELTGNGLAPVAWQDGQASPSIEFGEACVGGSIVRTAVLVNTGDFPDAEISRSRPLCPLLVGHPRGPNTGCSVFPHCRENLRERPRSQVNVHLPWRDRNPGFQIGPERERGTVSDRIRPLRRRQGGG